jgi:hypothetical protein
MDSKEKINGKVHHTHDFPEKTLSFECMEQKSIKNYEFLLFFVVFFFFLSCAIGAQRSREKENSSRENRENNFARAFFGSLPASCGGSRTPQTFLHPKIAYNIPFFNAF